VREYPRELIVA